MSLNQETQFVNGESCHNCSTVLTGKYCSYCGQDSHFKLVTVRYLLGDLAEKILLVDHRVLHTLRVLLFSPGQFAIDYIAGRRQRYYSPVKLYFAASVLFFFSLRLVPGIDVELSLLGLSIETHLSTLSNIHSSTGLGFVDSVINQIGSMPPDLRDHIIRSGILAHGTQALLCFIPLIAGCLALLYPKRYFQEHLVVALSIHIFIFCALLTGVFPWPGLFHEFLNDVLNLLLLSYVCITLKRFYGGNWSLTLFKTLGLAGLYTLMVMISFFLGMRFQI